MGKTIREGGYDAGEDVAVVLAVAAGAGVEGGRDTVVVELAVEDVFTVVMIAAVEVACACVVVAVLGEDVEVALYEGVGAGVVDVAMPLALPTTIWRWALLVTLALSVTV